MARIDPEMVERLKQNKTVYGECTEEERQCFEDVGWRNCLIYNSYGNWEHKVAPRFALHYVHCIKADYQPPKREREIEWLEVESEEDTGCLVVRLGKEPDDVRSLCCCANELRFAGKAKFIIDGKEQIECCLRGHNGEIPTHVAFWKEQQK